ELLGQCLLSGLILGMNRSSHVVQMLFGVIPIDNAVMTRKMTTVQGINPLSPVAQHQGLGALAYPPTLGFQTSLYAERITVLHRRHVRGDQRHGRQLGRRTSRSITGDRQHLVFTPME